MATITITNNGAPILASTLVISNIITDISSGVTTYTLEVKYVTFEGFIMSRFMSGISISSGAINNVPFENNITMWSFKPKDEMLSVSLPITIPVGVYSCSINVNAITIDAMEHSYISGAVSYNTQSGVVDNTEVIASRNYVPQIG